MRPLYANHGAQRGRSGSCDENNIPMMRKPRLEAISWTHMTDAFLKENMSRSCQMYQKMRRQRGATIIDPKTCTNMAKLQETCCSPVRDCDPEPTSPRTWLSGQGSLYMQQSIQKRFQIVQGGRPLCMEFGRNDCCFRHNYMFDVGGNTLAQRHNSTKHIPRAPSTTVVPASRPKPMEAPRVTLKCYTTPHSTGFMLTSKSIPKQLPIFYLNPI